MKTMVHSTSEQNDMLRIKESNKLKDLLPVSVTFPIPTNNTNNTNINTNTSTSTSTTATTTTTKTTITSTARITDMAQMTISSSSATTWIETKNLKNNNAGDNNNNNNDDDEDAIFYITDSEDENVGNKKSFDNVVKNTNAVTSAPHRHSFPSDFHNPATATTTTTTKHHKPVLDLTDSSDDSSDTKNHHHKTSSLQSIFSKSNSANARPGEISDMIFTPVIAKEKKKSLSTDIINNSCQAQNKHEKEQTIVQKMDDTIEKKINKSIPRKNFNSHPMAPFVVNHTLPKQYMKSSSAHNLMVHHQSETYNSPPESASNKRMNKYDLVYLTSSPLVTMSVNGFRPLAQLDLKEECDRLFNTLKSYGIKLHVKHAVATFSSMITAFTSGCRVLHYSGPGLPQSLTFENPKNIGEDHFVSCNLIRRACQDAKYGPKLVFASSRNNDVVGETFVEAGIKHVITVKTDFDSTDDIANEFTSQFYHSLLNGYTISDAFQQAKNAAINLPGIEKPDEKKFTLLPEDLNGRIHSVRLFQPEEIEPGELIDDSTPLPPNNLPLPIPHFIGRNIDTIQTIQHVVDSGVKIVGVTGAKGVGKSALAIMTARYLCHRLLFKGGVFYVDVAKLLPKYSSLEAMVIKTMKSSEKYQHIPDSEFFGAMHNFGRLLLIFDHVDALDAKNNDDCNEGEASTDGNESDSENDDAYSGKDETASRTKSNSNASNSVRLRSQRYRSQKRHNKKLQHLKKKKARKFRNMVKHFFSTVLDLTRCEIKVLVTSTTKRHELGDLRGGVVRYQVLQELSDEESAKLFTRLVNQFQWQDVLAHRKFMTLLGNNPGDIHKIAQIKHIYECDNLDLVIQACEQKQRLEHKYRKTDGGHYKSKSYHTHNSNESGHDRDIKLKKEQTHSQQHLLLDDFITDPKARMLWTKAKGTTVVSFQAIFEELRKVFLPISSMRPLREEDILQVFNSRISQTHSLTVEIFESFYQWFVGVCELVSMLKDLWNNTNPVTIHGFVSRSEAERKLQLSKPGAFLIRFSTTQTRSIAISYREDTSVQHISGLLVYDKKFLFKGYQYPFKLSYFITCYSKLTHLFCEPQLIPKSQVFWGEEI